MTYGLGRSVVRLHLGGARTISSRVRPLLFAFQRVSDTNYSLLNTPKRVSPSSISLQSQHDRSYATRPASRPKAHTGRTTSSPRVKKPTKAVAEPTEAVTDSADAGVKVEVKATKFKATKVKATKAKTKEKTKAKAKAKPKKKKAVKAKAKPKVKAKAKTARKPKKPLTEEGKAAAKAKAQRALITELRRIALKPPVKKPMSVWMVVNQEVARTGKSTVLSSGEAKTKYKNLTTEEIEHYNHIGIQNKAENAKAYQAWLDSHTPDDIRKANIARNRLTRLGVKGYSKRIIDDRLVKRPAFAHVLFLKERYESGEMKGIAAPDATRRIMQEWKELGEADKQKFYAMQAEEQARYIEGVQKVYHRTIDLSATSPPQVSATATV